MSTAKLDGQITGVTEDGKVVAVQLWSGFDRSRHALVTVQDGSSQVRAGNGTRIKEQFGRCGIGEKSEIVTPERARALLVERGFDPGNCGFCGTALPIGRRWCTKCGKQPEGRA